MEASSTQMLAEITPGTIHVTVLSEKKEGIASKHSLKGSWLGTLFLSSFWFEKALFKHLIYARVCFP